MINKIDLLPKDERITVTAKIVKAIKYKGEVFCISSLNGLGCKNLIKGIFKLTKEFSNE